MHHKNYDVWISCDDEPLPEFSMQAEGDDGKTLACFIPSERGKNFVINWKDDGSDEDIALSFSLDGVALRHGSHTSCGSSGMRSGALTGANIKQPFQFSGLQTTDDDALLGGQDQISNLGTIKISIKRVWPEGRRIPFYPEGFDAVGAVHERSKKAGAHSVSLGRGEELADPVTYLIVRDPVDPLEGYAAHFVFRYRPLELLQAQDIAPRTPNTLHSSIPSSSSQTKNRALKRHNSNVDKYSPDKRPRHATSLDTDVIELSDDDDDFKTLQRRLRESQRELVKIQNKMAKVQKLKSGTSSAIGVKKEPRNPLPQDDDVIDDSTCVQTDILS